MRIKCVLIGLLALSCGLGHAQNEDDALRYSMTYFGGSARNMATAGGLTAMGADFANASQNPAGLGRLTKSNFSFTQNLEIPSVKTDFYGSTHSTNRFAYNISNISYVKAYKLDPDQFNNWYSVQIGIGMNRIKSFNDSVSYNGIADSSILHSFIKEAEGYSTAVIYDYFPFTAGLAYDVFAIDPGSSSDTYVTQFNQGKANHVRKLKRSGGITEYSLFTMSGNYANKLLIGASVNYVHAKYTEYLNHKEFYTDSSLWLNSIEYLGRLDIIGRGVNLRVGAIYSPTKEIRIGLGIETPTSFWMQDYWENDMISRTDDGEKYVLDEYKPSGAYDYKIRTPFKANLSAAAVLNDYGSVGFEVEFVDYSSARLKSKNNTTVPYSFISENAQIDNIYKPVMNYKFGVEGRITKQLYARGGLAYYGTPFTAASGNAQNPAMFITAGAGYNFGVMYMDLAYVLLNKKEDYYAYDPTVNGSLATFNNRNSQVALTIGARF